MGIDITLHLPSNQKGSGQPALALENDGYYWFLHQLFSSLAEHTGRYIDLYGETSFRLHELAHLDRFLFEARALVSEQPKQWQVNCGTQTHPVKKEILESVTQKQFKVILDQLENIVNKARESKGVITFEGD